MSFCDVNKVENVGDALASMKLFNAVRVQTGKQKFPNYLDSGINHRRQIIFALYQQNPAKQSNMATTLSSISPESRIWIYGAERALTSEETNVVRSEIQSFVSEWVSHRQDLKAAADVLHNRFLVVAVDESQAEASGCSIDGSVNKIKEIGAQIEVDFFNRMMFSYRDQRGNIHTVSKDEFKDLYHRGKVPNDAIVFDTLIKEVGELRQIFERPLEDSWHSRMV